ncbi:enoyl-CoA hydratase/isomerase family protein [Phaeacidiphilus oryzae]|uniref:enoyl-CoA hydratase/isomerase family protein n=1 Tax=Phaeacidiphilus oryzae TaxID=348818 RepID=UPI00056D48C3|nr:enoyl-CoA hydratase/isomerase family protein [Phaeacidiphilus oryzae]
MTNDYKTIRYEERDRVAWVTLDRPEVHNAFNMEMLREIRHCWRSLRDNDDIGAVVVTGAGDKAFCAGLDRADIADPDGVRDIPERTEIRVHGHTPLHFDDPSDWISPKTGADLWKPMIAAVNGMACAGAFYLLGQVEFIIASDDATFFDPHTAYGMPAVYEPMSMLQRMPIGEVMRMTLMGDRERLSAARAHQIGLVQEVVPRERLHEAAHRAAAIIADQPDLAVQTTVRAVWYAQEMGYRQALDVARTLVQLGTGDEALAEGQRRFGSGRRPPWTLR